MKLPAPVGMMLFILALVSAAAAYAAWRLAQAARTTAKPPPLPPILEPDCSVPKDAATISGLSASTTGGVHRAKEIVLAAGVVIELKSTLVLVADTKLEINGTITYAAPVTTPVHIILVCLQGNVVVNGTLGLEIASRLQGQTPPPTVVNGLFANATGLPGGSAGYIKLVAPAGSIDVQGSVRALSGGWGGDGLATGTSFNRGMIGGRATAAGGPGGAPGTVRFCAYEAINIGASAVVIAGGGGAGGAAQATAVNGREAIALGGLSQRGGDVHLAGLAPGATCQVFHYGLLQGGFPMYPNIAKATGGNALSAMDRGGRAEAHGSAGRPSGTVFFDNCLVVMSSTGATECWRGGAGAPAEATGGNGFTGVNRGSNGGDAFARGGNAGSDIPVPELPMVDGTTRDGTQRTQPGIGIAGIALGKGGDANALAGNGANHPTRPGASGAEDALGGQGANSTQATPATAAPVPGAAPGGGIAVGSISIGA